MNLIRSDEQTALNEIIVACQTTIDHYAQAAEVCEQPEATATLQKIRARREPLLQHFSQAVRAQGELPSAPDLDKETGEQLINRISAALSKDETSTMIHQRIEGERELQNILEEQQRAVSSDQYAPLLQELGEDIQAALKDLKALDI